MSLEDQKNKSPRQGHIRETIPGRKTNDGHVTGQETPYRQRPCGLCGVDIAPEITAFSEQAGGLIVLGFQHLGVGPPEQRR